MNFEFEQAKQHFTQGIAYFEAGRFKDAEQSFSAAQKLMPGRPSVLTNLGAARVKLGRYADAVAPLEQATAAEPDNLEAWSHLALSLATLGAHAPALVAFDKALALNDKSATLWTHRGTLMRETGNADEAVASFEKALALGADKKLIGYFLASVKGGAAPQEAPRAYVEHLFDEYADEFQNHVVGTLGYRAHERLVRDMPRGSDGLPRQFDNVLDLGCGTGLCGTQIKPYARRVTGVDLSRRMLDKAGDLHVYDELVHADVGEYLAGIEGGGQFDLVLAADVFIYVGALEAVFANVARVLKPGGLFAFTVETPEDAGAQDLVLQPSLRYQHPAAYVERAARANGFTVKSRQAGTLREEQRKPIAGLYFHLERP